MYKHALSANNQQIIIAKYITKYGSVNRYDADAIGVCHLAARIKELKYKGIIFNWVDEKVFDPHGIEHDRVRRYSFKYKAMNKEEIEKLNKLLGKS